MEDKEIYAIDREIGKVQKKLKELKEKRNKYYIQDLSEDYMNKHILIRYKVDPDYIHECIFVRDIYNNEKNPNFLEFVGNGFYYSEGNCINKRYCHISEFLNVMIYKEQIENGDVQITILTKDEYKEEARKMMDFIKKSYEI